ncbi:FdtA/QdtA family cupin domain-containing protein [Pedobacter nutrimenti]|uniref:sugar 3,4-ketoisomerase n=1 Tax=Pedobacter nutrimenti TaxID=1241337 RepID=UPI00292E35A5|nr:FdtA/QdtA family cupin domain-containing protein [Pedobacter nutrimenti]
MIGPKIIDLPKILDERGNLSFLQHSNQIPFEVERCFWLYDVPGGEIRGGHAYKKQEEIIIALSGSFDIVITNLDGTTVKYSLNRSYYGLYLPALTWRHMENFSTNSLSLHITNRAYEASDYIRDFSDFKKGENNA